MRIDTWKKVARFTIMTLGIALLTMSTSAQEQPARPSTGTPIKALTGEVLAEQVTATFAPLPLGWVTEQNVMDPIWETLGYKGVNYYAYGGPVSEKDFASRNDPDSQQYQAWFGVYVVVGGKAVFGSGNQKSQCDAVAKLAEYDQRSWLGAMGDPAPLAQSEADPSFSSILIAGSERQGCSFDIKSHSDLSMGDTPLAKHMGMPPFEKWKDRLAPFHELMLHVFGAWWYEPKRDVTLIVYGASSAFKNKAGSAIDNGPALASSLRQTMTQVRLTDAVAGRP